MTTVLPKVLLLLLGEGAMASALDWCCAGRVTRRRSDYELREELVLRTLQLGHLGSRKVAPAPVGVGVSSGLVPVVIRQRCLGDERTDAGVVGSVVEHGKLLLGDGKLLARLHESLVHLGETSLDDLLLHARSVGRRGPPSRIKLFWS